MMITVNTGMDDLTMEVTVIPVMDRAIQLKVLAMVMVKAGFHKVLMCLGMSEIRMVPGMMNVMNPSNILVTNLMIAKVRAASWKVLRNPLLARTDNVQVMAIHPNPESSAWELIF